MVRALGLGYRVAGRVFGNAFDVRRLHAFAPEGRADEPLVAELGVGGVPLSVLNRRCRVRRSDPRRPLTYRRMSRALVFLRVAYFPAVFRGRSVENAARSSSVKMPGTSQAAKWPPLRALW